MPFSLVQRKQVRTPGFAELSGAQPRWRAFFPQAASRAWERALAESIPHLDIRETPKAFLIQADVPGLKKEDLDLNVSGTRLTLAGKRPPEAEKEDETYLLRERHHERFSRSLTLPEDVDPDRILAELSDGVLFLTLPKSPEARSRRIAILGH